MRKLSKLLGDLPSEQIFYRNIPLGAPDRMLVRLNFLRFPLQYCSFPRWGEIIQGTVFLVEENKFLNHWLAECFLSIK